MMRATPEQLGKVAYSAYVEVRAMQDGEPAWEALTDEQRAQWMFTALAVQSYLIRPPGPPVPP